jgi:endonuclease YncB( thermonuclease family)
MKKAINWKSVFAIIAGILLSLAGSMIATAQHDTRLAQLRRVGETDTTMIKLRKVADEAAAAAWERSGERAHLDKVIAEVKEVVAATKASFLTKGTVTKVTDGDTFTLFTEEGSTVTIRLYGIDCPELKQNFGAIAAYAAAHYIYGKEVEVEILGKDLYSRKIAVVYVDGFVLNEKLLSDGLAWNYALYNLKFCELYAKLETEARTSREGLWVDEKPVPPWEYRKLIKEVQKQKRSSK